MKRIEFVMGYHSYSLVGEINKSPESLPCVKEGGTMNIVTGGLSTKQSILTTDLIYIEL